MLKDTNPVAELICELTRNCNIKEEYFASSFNLSPTEVRLLKLFVSTPTYTIKEIRDRLKLTPGRITHILTSLEAKKLISRSLDANDKRVILVSLMPKANPLIKNLNENYNELHNRILQNVKEEEIEKILSSLEILVDVFRKWVNQK
ncbi:MAG: MarR family transcriptional regulator [Ignavibacteriaceae bacterium]|nr:MarR family transcriptional regulator [Ignavibacteriaceae bacterium]